MKSTKKKKASFGFLEVINSFILKTKGRYCGNCDCQKGGTLERLRKYRLCSWQAAEELQGINTAGAGDIRFFYMILARTKDPEVI